MLIILKKELRKVSKNVVLIGVGGIGFRHFQALFNCNNEIDIYVIDINKSALDKAKEYSDSIDTSKRVFFLEELDDVPEKIIVSIIATSSLPRRSIFEKLIEKHTVYNIIFEKFMFPSIDDYEYVEDLLKKNKINAYVDCPARIYEVYNEIKTECKKSNTFKAYVKGSNWGLACNSIHLVDQIAYMSDADTDKVICTGVLENTVYDSKRIGYKEFYGKIIGSIGDGISFSIECDHFNNPLTFECFSDNTYYCVNESERLFTKVLLNKPNDVKTVSIDIPYVSQITNINVDSIIEGETVFLPTFYESKPLHKALLSMFLKQIRDVDNSDTNLCPIT